MTSAGEANDAVDGNARRRRREEAYEAFDSLFFSDFDSVFGSDFESDFVSVFVSPPFDSLLFDDEDDEDRLSVL